jgi:nucleoside-diphosphate-sugar epimerase
MINLFGGNGYLGKEYQKVNEKCIVNSRNDLTVKSADVLYMISTITNYNVKVNPYIDIDTNLTTLIHVLENMRKEKFTRPTFNFVSSWFVYGTQENMPVKEDAYCDPKGFYGITKRTAEQLLISYCETYNIDYRILRMANIIGGTDPKASAQKNALTWIVGKLKRNEPVELYDGGEFLRDYISVEDAARAVHLVCQHGKRNEIYNISNNMPIKFKDIIDYAVEKIGSKSEIINIPQRDFHKKVQAKDMYLDGSKIKELGYQIGKGAYKTIDDLIDNPAV